MMNDCCLMCLMGRMLVQGKAQDVKQHRWFESFDWEALAARKLAAPRKPRDDAAKRIRELAVSSLGHGGGRLPCHRRWIFGRLETMCLQAWAESACMPSPHMSTNPATSFTLLAMWSDPVQDTERKQRAQPKETPEEIAEAEAVFAEF